MIASLPLNPRPFPSGYHQAVLPNECTAVVPASAAATSIRKAISSSDRGFKKKYGRSYQPVTTPVAMVKRVCHEIGKRFKVFVRNGAELFSDREPYSFPQVLIAVENTFNAPIMCGRINS